MTTEDFLPQQEPEAQGFPEETDDQAAPELSGPPPDTPEEPVPANAIELAALLIRHCENCPLSQTRTNAVPGEGPQDAQVMIIAEGPGKHEDRQGRPFVGAAGKFLDELLPMAGLSRDQVFITNMIKCRAPGNRDPEPEEMAACSRHLERQITIINPKLIIALGKFSLSKFLPGETIGKARGRLRRKNGRFIYPVMHPAAGLRRGDFKQSVIEDFQAIPAVLRQIDDDPPGEEPEAPLKAAPNAAPGQPLLDDGPADEQYPTITPIHPTPSTPGGPHPQEAHNLSGQTVRTATRNDLTFVDALRAKE